MIEPYEQFAITKYLLQLLTHGRLQAKALSEICEFLERNSSFLGLEPWEEMISEQLEDLQKAMSEKSGVRTAYRKTLSAIKGGLENHYDNLKGTPPGNLENNLAILAGELVLGPVERDFFGLLLRYHIHDNFQNLYNEITREHLNLHETCAYCLGLEPHTITDLLRPSSRLLSSGIIGQPGHSGNDFDDQFEIPDAVRTGLQKACGVKEDIRHYILGHPATPSLDWNDFDHLGETRDRLAAYLTAALERRIPGVNILLWGPPGTGKTEFCKTLAAHLDVTLYALGEKDEDGREPNRRERTACLQLAQNLLRFGKKSLLLFDEMDDLFEENALARLFGAKLAGGSRVFTHRLFENNPVPTLWIINDPQILDAAVIRRMSLAIEITIPPVKTREKV